MLQPLNALAENALAETPHAAHFAPRNIYDFDDTIYAGDSSIHLLKFALANRPALALRWAPTFALAAGKHFLGLASKEQLKSAFFSFLRNLPAAETTALITRFWDSHRHRLKPWYLAQKQPTDIIISASPEFLLAPLVRSELQLTLIASPVDQLTGAFTGTNCHDSEKVRRLRSELPDVQIAAFYSDSLADTPLAEIAPAAYIVRGEKLIPWCDYRPSLISRLKRTFLAKDFLLFVLCGGTGTLVNFTVSTALSQTPLFRAGTPHFAGYGPTLAYALGYAASITVTYTLNAKLIFHRSLTAGDFAKFVISYIPNFLILFTFVAVFINALHLNEVLVYALAGLLGLPLTWLLVKCFAFRKKH